MMQVRHHVLDRRFKLDYPEGTRCTTLTFEGPGNTPASLDWQHMIDTARYEFVRRYGDELRESHPNFEPMTDLFVTIGFTTFQVLVEVSDRMVEK